MVIISHRGYWLHPAEKNHPDAFRRSFDLGFGTETDVRDSNGKLVISHDVPTGGEIELSELLKILGKRNLPLALNIKSDGLSKILLQEMRRSSLNCWFTFDMSVPEAVAQIANGIPVFTRASEYEKEPPYYEDAIGIWLDAFRSDWYRLDTISRFLTDGKRVCIVSPELHGRDPKPLWSSLRDSAITQDDMLMLCTDRPMAAKSYLKIK